MKLEIKENELYQELEIFFKGTKIGEAEVDLSRNMISRLSVLPNYQNLGFGTEVVKLLSERYNCNCLWVNADNERAIHVYEKNGYEKIRPTMYLMELKTANLGE
jgi:ribosomal protein S18 acetylase RimI-like enzyme